MIDTIQWVDARKYMPPNHSFIVARIKVPLTFKPEYVNREKPEVCLYDAHLVFVAYTFIWYGLEEDEQYRGTVNEIAWFENITIDNEILVDAEDELYERDKYIKEISTWCGKKALTWGIDNIIGWVKFSTER